jgi:sirohydrochlorin ferrochelatase
MAFRTHLLVVANQTVDSPELLGALAERAERGPVSATLLVPTPWREREAARGRLEQAIAHLRERGVQADGLLGDGDPMVAVQEAWDPARFDEVVVSTLSASSSRWLQVDLPSRVARLTDCNATHVEASARPAGPSRAPTPPPERRPLFESALSLMRSGTRRPA